MAQTEQLVSGQVSFKSSKNIYVKFISTNGIEVADTLFIQRDMQWIPALLVQQKSSTSCVTTNLTTFEISIGDNIGYFERTKIEPIDVIPPTLIQNETIVTLDSVEGEPIKDIKKRKQTLNGRFSLSTNASLNPDQQRNFQRVRAAFSLNIQNVKESAFSTQTYLTYRHRYGVDQTTTDFYDDFKVYTLAVQYAPSSKYNVTLGRKINQNIANMGSIDGAQFDYHFNKYTVGGFAGTRPDFTNFTFNPNLAQFGAYIVRKDQTTKGLAQTSLAIAEQQNGFKTDRRFMYFQHNNSLVKNLNLFFSSELDLFKKVNDTVSYQPQLTSIYASLRYKLRKNLAISASYDNRRNIIFYESYQTFIDQLLAQETRQGFRLQANYSPFKSISINASSFYRYQGDNPKPTKNYVGNINFNNFLHSKASMSININLLESYYFKGTILGGRLNKNFFKGKIGGEINFRNVNYTFFNSESSLNQNIFGTNFNFNIYKRTSAIISYEGTFEPTRQYHRYFFTINQRFKN